MQTITHGTRHLDVLPPHPTPTEAAAAELGFLAQAAANAPIPQSGSLAAEVTDVLANLSPGDVIRTAALLVEQLRDQVAVTHFYQAGDNASTPF